MGVLTAAQASAMRRVQAVANDVLPRIEFLEALANVSPELAARVRDLRTQREYLYNLALTALELDRSMGNGTAQPWSAAPAATSPPPATVIPGTGGNQTIEPGGQPWVNQQFWATPGTDDELLARARRAGRAITLGPSDGGRERYTWMGNALQGY